MIEIVETKVLEQPNCVGAWLWKRKESQTFWIEVHVGAQNGGSQHCTIIKPSGKELYMADGEPNYPWIGYWILLKTPETRLLKTTEKQ